MVSKTGLCKKTLRVYTTKQILTCVLGPAHMVQCTQEGLVHGHAPDFLKSPRSLQTGRNREKQGGRGLQREAVVSSSAPHGAACERLGKVGVTQPQTLCAGLYG